MHLNTGSYSRLLQTINKQYLAQGRLYATARSPGGEPPKSRRKSQKAQESSSDPSSSLADRYKAVISSRKVRGDRSRIDVVSPELCDDILDRLAPSLRRHEGCDIIEVNPGVGLWSSKIHEQLKPRTHILMEPDEGIYRPFLDPLLEAKGSRYRHVPWSGQDWASYERLIDKGMLSKQHPLDRGDPLKDRPNDSLLFMANFAHYPSKRAMGYNSVSLLMLYQLMTAIRTHSLFQAYGLVRMIIWIMDREKSTIVPRSISERRKTTVEIEYSCESVVEVAGGEGTGSRTTREKMLALDSAVNVSKSMRSQGIHTPCARKPALQLQADAALAQSEQDQDLSTAVRQLTTTYRWDDELESLEKQLGMGEIIPFEDVGPAARGEIALEKKPGRVLGKRVKTEKYARLLHLRSIRKGIDRAVTTIDQILCLSKDISQLAQKILKTDDSNHSPTSSPLRTQIIELQKKQGALFSTLKYEQRRKLLHYNDDRAAYNLKSKPLLFYDHRPYHPLLTQPHEFTNRQQGLSLLDVQPAPPSAALQENPRIYTTFDLLAKWIFSRRAKPFVKELEALAPGAVEALVPQVPSLRDRLREDEISASAASKDDSSGAADATDEDDPNADADAEDEDSPEGAGAGADDDDSDEDFLGIRSRKSISEFRVRMLTPEMLEGLAIAWEGWLFRPSATDLYNKVEAKYDNASYKRALYGGMMDE